MYYFCTYFDRNYLIKGLSLYRSLCRCCNNSFTLYILCMDDLSYDVLVDLKLKGIIPIRLEEFEDEQLIACKKNRTKVEYYWTCTPSLPLYILENFKDVELITYLDADIYFYSSLEPIFEEFGDRSILITPHRFIPELRHLEVNGRYNVQFVSFRRDDNGMACLRWWRDRCLEWCYNRLEDEKIGDQKYLDVWPSKFSGVHELEHIGAGVAPWNFANYSIATNAGEIFIDSVPLIFYHFHQFRVLEGKRYFYASQEYLLGKPIPRKIYALYKVEIESCYEEVRRSFPDFSFGMEESYWRMYLKESVRRIFPVPVKNLIKRVLSEY